MSRVGGGGYAENRGGFGDRTGGGMSGNARDGRDGTGNRGGADRYSGAQMLNPRRTPQVSPSYEASLKNFAKLATRAIPGPGMIGGAIADIGGWRPGFTGFQGNVNTPGSYDPTNRALQNGMYRGQPQRMTPNIARANALAPAAPAAAIPAGPKQWWRTPFPAPNRPFGPVA